MSTEPSLIILGSEVRNSKLWDMVTTEANSVQIKFVLEKGDDPICFPSQIDQTEAVNGKLG